MSRLATPFPCRVVVVMAAGAWSSLTSFEAHAVVRTWSSSNNGIFTDIGNWAPNDAYPGPGDAAEFNSGAVAYTVTFPGSFINPPLNYVVDRLVVRTNDVTFSSQSFISPNLTVANPEGSIVIGGANGAAILNMTLRSLTGATIDVGDAVGFGALNVRNGARVNSNVLNVGRGNFGTLLIEAGGRVVADDANIGRSGQSDTVTVRGANSTLTINDVLNLSDLADMTIQGGGALVTGDAFINSNFPEAIAIVRITGAGSTWTNSGDIRIGGVDVFGSRYGELAVLDGALLSVGGGIFVEAGQHPGDFSSSLIGKNGTIAGSVTNHGYVQPGIRVRPAPYTPGALHIDGIYHQSATGMLGIGITGTTPGTQYDQLQVNGPVALNGRLSIILHNSFQPSAGDAFDILDWGSLSGAFSTVTLPALAAGLSWNTSQLYVTGIISVVEAPTFTADFDDDGDVDGDDLTQWQGDFDVNGMSDADEDGDSDGADFLAWQQQAGSVPAVTAAENVPEPAAITFAGVVAAMVGLVRPRAQGGGGSSGPGVRRGC